MAIVADIDSRGNSGNSGRIEETDGPDVISRIAPSQPPDAMSFLNKNSLVTLHKDPVLKGLSTLDRDRKLIQQLADIDLLNGTAAAVVPGAVLTPSTVAATVTAAASALPMTVDQTAPRDPSPTALPSRLPLISAAQYVGLTRGIHSGPRPDPVVVIIRHGKTEYNKLGLFTGWEDVALADEGRNEAMAAGKLLKLHGITFDVVYTSWLSRAIETAWLVVRPVPPCPVSYTPISPTSLYFFCSPTHSLLFPSLHLSLHPSI